MLRSLCSTVLVLSVIPCGPRPSRAESEDDRLAATFGAGLDFRFADGLDDANFVLWAGAKYYLGPERVAPFIAGGVELAVGMLPWMGPLEVSPQMRLGLARLDPPPQDRVSRTFPQIQIYGLAGYRWRFLDHHHVEDPRSRRAARLGVGVGAPVIVRFLESPAPTSAEIVVDLSGPTDVEQVGLRVLMGF